MNDFLTEAQLYVLTKRTHSSARIRVLKKQGIAFKLDGDGAPVVSWASVNAVSGKVSKKNGPNHEALARLMHGASAKDRPRAPEARLPVPRRLQVSPEGR